MGSVGVLRKADEESPQVMQNLGGTPGGISLQIPVGGGKRDSLPEQSPTERSYQQSIDAQMAGQEAQEQLANRPSLPPDPKDKYAHQVQTEELERQAAAGKPQSQFERLGQYGGERGGERDYQRAGQGGVRGRNYGDEASRIFGVMRGLTSLGQAGASGQDLLSGAGGAALQGYTSAQTAKPHLQNVGGEVGKRVGVYGGQVADKAGEIAQPYVEGAKNLPETWKKGVERTFGDQRPQPQRPQPQRPQPVAVAPPMMSHEEALEQRKNNADTHVPGQLPAAPVPVAPQAAQFNPAKNRFTGLGTGPPGDFSASTQVAPAGGVAAQNAMDMLETQHAEQTLANKQNYSNRNWAEDAAKDWERNQLTPAVGAPAPVAVTNISNPFYGLAPQMDETVQNLIQGRNTGQGPVNPQNSGAMINAGRNLAQQMGSPSTGALSAGAPAPAVASPVGGLAAGTPPVGVQPAVPPSVTPQEAARTIGGGPNVQGQ